MRRLTFTNNRGESIEFYLSPLLIESLEGIGEVEAELQEQVAPYRDGSIHIDAILRPRFIELEGSITNINLEEIRKKRQELSRVCNPKLGLGKITLELDGSIKEIHGVPEGSVVFPDRERNPFQPFMITWKCPDPYWKDLQEVSRDLKAYEGKFTFPFQFPVQFGIESDNTTLINEGDTSAPVIIEIKGPIRRPIIENLTTGKYMQINAIIEADQTLVIDTNPRNKRVEIKSGGETRKVMGFFDHGGDFWQLDVGENEIRYRADAGIADAVATVSWQNQYVGI